jgi:hypothetical protein
MTTTTLSASALESTVSALVGRRITSVVYYDLPFTTGVAWDFDDWHDVVMGIAFGTADGRMFSASWSSYLTDYGIEMSLGTMGQYLGGIGEPNGPRVWEVTDHPRWRRLLSGPVTDARVLWDRDPLDPADRVPLAIRLTFAAGDAWVIAGSAAVTPHDGRFHLGTDDVMVGFTAEFAERLGLNQ